MIAPSRQCHMCGDLRAATDLATMNEWSYCHGVVDPSPTCYQLRQWRAEGKDIAIETGKMRRSSDGI